MTSLGKGERLSGNQELKSLSGKYIAKIDLNGLFTVYYRLSQLWQYRIALSRVEMRNNGDLVFVGKNNLIVRNFDTARRNGDYAVIREDGTMAVYSVTGQQLNYFGSRLSKHISYG